MALLRPVARKGGRLRQFADGDKVPVGLLEVGTAASADLTATDTDATPGRALKTSDFGIGGAVSAWAPTDLNELYVGGLYRYTASALNAPFPGIPGTVQVIGRAADGSAWSQLATAAAGGANRLAVRSKSQGVLTPWAEAWTTLNLEKQAGQNDVTSGRVLTVGAFGLGTAAAPVTADCNAITTNGLYGVTSTTANTPVAGMFGTLLMTGRAASEQTQFCFNNSSADQPRVYVRNRYAAAVGVWGPWSEVWNSYSLVKTSSATDTTVGRMLKVGDFGIGTDSQPTNIDPNSVRYGAVMAPVSQPNAPATECSMWSAGRSAGARASQFAIDHGVTTRAWSRAYNSGRVGSEWGQWVEHWTSAGTNAVTVDTGSLGYGTGAGGTVTQATSKTTAVTLNKPSGRVTTAADSLAAGAEVSFQLTNSKIAATDIVLVSSVSGSGIAAYEVSSWGVSAGFCYIRIKNISASAAAHAVSINFVVIKGALA